MKRILLLALPLLFLISCSKEEVALPPVDESQWLNKERAFVRADAFGCDYFVAETSRGFVLMRSWSGAAPFSGSVLYGDFNTWGLRSFYNRSGGYLIRADIRDYYFSWFQAMDAMERHCGPSGF